jgi:hypothetical protein
MLTQWRASSQWEVQVLSLEGARRNQANAKRRLLSASIHTAAKLAHKVADLLTPAPLQRGYGKG